MGFCGPANGRLEPRSESCPIRASRQEGEGKPGYGSRRPGPLKPGGKLNASSCHAWLCTSCRGQLRRTCSSRRAWGRPPGRRRCPRCPHRWGTRQQTGRCRVRWRAGSVQWLALLPDSSMQQNGCAALAACASMALELLGHCVADRCHVAALHACPPTH